jgi:N-succinyldiaminopimelate aminotransferase
VWAARAATAWAQTLAHYTGPVRPGSLLARSAQGHNPGIGRVRMALVASADECLEAADRIVSYVESL